MGGLAVAKMRNRMVGTMSAVETVNRIVATTLG